MRNSISIKIAEHFVEGQWIAYIETNKGERYYGIYSHPVTKEMVLEDFQEDKNNFYLIK